MACGRGLGILLSCCLALVSLSALSRDLQLPPDYKLVWADEFSIDGPPDPAKWGHDTQRNKLGWHNNELQYYSGPGQGNAQVQGGVLHIVARQDPGTQPGDPFRLSRIANRLAGLPRADVQLLQIRE